LRGLGRELTSCGAQFINGEVEELVVLPGGGVQVSLRGGASRFAKELVVSESVGFSRVTAFGRSRLFSTRSNSYATLMIRVGGAEGRFLSYVELPDDPVVARVSDVTDYCRGSIRSGERILVCEIPGAPSDLGDNGPVPSVVLGRLEELGVVPEGLTLLEHTVSRLVLRRGERSLIKGLRELKSGAVTIVPSRGDFAHSVHRNRLRWRRFGNSTTAVHPEDANWGRLTHASGE
jgi:hypothetical protein